MTNALPLIKIVGVSAAGKSTLVAGLREKGYNARPASQEHSEIPDMWRRIRPPALLIYLDADLAAQQQRRPDVTWDAQAIATEKARLRHAQLHADLYIDTRRLSADEVLEQALRFLREKNIPHEDGPLPPVPPTGGVAKS